MHNLRLVVDSINFGGGYLTKRTGLNIERLLEHDHFIYVLYNERASEVDASRNLVCFHQDGRMRWVAEPAPAKAQFAPGWKSIEIKNCFIVVTNSVNAMYRISLDTGQII